MYPEHIFVARHAEGRYPHPPPQEQQMEMSPVDAAHEII